MPRRPRMTRARDTDLPLESRCPLNEHPSCGFYLFYRAFDDNEAREDAGMFLWEFSSLVALGSCIQVVILRMVARVRASRTPNSPDLCDWSNREANVCAPPGLLHIVTTRCPVGSYTYGELKAFHHCSSKHMLFPLERCPGKSMGALLKAQKSADVLQDVERRVLAIHPPSSDSIKSAHVGERHKNCQICVASGQNIKLVPLKRGQLAYLVTEGLVWPQR